jgi:hypothetical protein
LYLKKRRVTRLNRREIAGISSSRSLDAHGAQRETLRGTPLRELQLHGGTRPPESLSGASSTRVAKKGRQA